jgi:hypothetical protein
MAGPEHFDMNDWFVKDGESYCPSEGEAFDIESCGTAACLAGHGAMLIKEANLAIVDPYLIANYYGIEYEAFYPGSWYDVNVDDFNLRVEADRLANGPSWQAEDRERIEWEAVIAYLDALIKRDA